MTISYNWLKEYVDIPESPDELAALLTTTGLEVESVRVADSIPGGLRGLVIGEVLTCVKHPNADKLTLTTVDVGKSAPLPIVCGAPNVAVGQKVIIALPGTTIHPSKGDPFTIKSARIRGEQSEGMICAEDEIGIGESHAGIMVLSTGLPNGTPAARHFNLESDSILEIGLTPNRADAASHIGVARDVRAANDREVRWPSVDGFRVDNNDLVIDVVVENAEACPRYSSLTLTNVKVSESPDWLKKRLQAVGLSPINNVVDVTNFICHELGQPLHAFDAAQTGKKVIVKTLPAGSKFVTLDNQERELTATDLMICNSNAGMCIAGVFGGIHSGITDTTTSIFLESACFSPAYVRRTSTHHQLKTDAAFRFARGTDPNLTVYALKRAALLLKEVAGASISSEIVDVYPSKVENRQIRMKDKNVNRLIGKAIPRLEVFEILRRLDIAVLDQTDNTYTVSVPPYRVDVEQEADVVEEVLRIYGFNKIELKDSARADYLSDFPEKDLTVYKRRIGEMLAAQGFYEIMTNSLTNAAYQQKYKLSFGLEPVEILNKLSEEQGVMRQTMLFTGLEAIAYNLNRKQGKLRFFEFGRTYGRNGRGFHEEERLALYVAGQHEMDSWQEKSRQANYHDLMQFVHLILERSNVTDFRLETTDDPILDYGMRIVRHKRTVGMAGKVRHAFARDLGIKQEVFYADFDTTLLFQGSNPKFDMLEVPRFPEVKRDLSLVLDRSVTFDDIRDIVANSAKNLIADVTLFDVYEGENIPRGKKAYALGFTLLDRSKTLTDEEIDKTMNGLMAGFEKRLGAVIRK